MSTEALIENAAPGQHHIVRNPLSKQLAIQPEDCPEFDDLLAAYQSQIRPAGSIQHTLFEELVSAAWNLRRVRILESRLDLLDPRSDRLAQHKSRFERTFHRALNQLKALQTEHALRHTLPREIRRRTPLLASIQKIAKRSQSPNLLPKPASPPLATQHPVGEPHRLQARAQAR